MRVHMRRVGVRDGIAGVVVQMHVDGTVGMAMRVKVDALARQPPQHMGAKPDQHDTDRRLQRPGEMVGDGMTEQDRGASEGEQGQGVSEPPGQAVLDDVADLAAARGNARHRRDMVGLERMLHSQKKAQSQNPEHASPKNAPIPPWARLTEARFRPEGHLGCPTFRCPDLTAV